MSNDENIKRPAAGGTLEPEVAKDDSLSPKEKLRKQQAKDIAYTINHAFACTFVDWLGVPAMVAIQRKLGVDKPMRPGCSNPFHDHGPDGHGDCGHDHHDHKHDHKHDHHDHHEHHEHHDHGHEPHDHAHEKRINNKHRAQLAGMFTASEIIGDFAGVVPTVLMQRYTPWAMDGIRPALRATLGPVFHYGAERSTNRWAAKYNISKDSPEYKDHLEKIYEHEMHHLPQAAWWTAWATAFNLGSQSFFYDVVTSKDVRERFPVGTLKERAIAKLGGASLSIFAVLGTRALFPDTSHKWTNWTEDHLITPLTKVTAGAIGIDGKTVDEAVQDKKRFHNGQWSERIKEEKGATNQMGLS